MAVIPTLTMANAFPKYNKYVDISGIDDIKEINIVNQKSHVRKLVLKFMLSIKTHIF